jgi:hypothetical protein
VDRRTDDDLFDQMVELCEQFEHQDQALRSRIVELMVMAEHQVAARVDISFETMRLQAENAALRERMAELEAQLRRTEDALHAVEQSRLFRAAAPVRSLYARVRR